MVMWTLCTVGMAMAGAFLLASLIASSTRPANFPPGPMSLPLLGYLPFLDVRNVGRSFRLLAKRYGNVFSIMVGTRQLVILNSWPIIKEAMETPELAGRPNVFSGTFFQKGHTGICTSEGETWKNQRGFFHDHMMTLSEGRGAQGFIDVIMDEIYDIKMELGRKVGEPIEVGYRLNIAIINMLWKIASGRRMHEQQQEFQTVYECIDKITSFMSRAVIMTFVPVLSRLLPEFISRMERGRYYRDRLLEISKKWIEEHKQAYKGNRSGDLQDLYLEKIRNGDAGFDESNLSAMLRELFVIGAESQSVLLRWAFRILSVNKDAQEKMSDELDCLIGESRDVQWEDRHQLHYTMAVLSEIQRFADIAPSGIPHKAICEVKFQGFTLPKGTNVVANLNSCHRDPTYWRHPDKFYPEHFLDAAGKFVADREGFVPFGVGIRKCPAADVARMQIFLVIANLCKSFAFTTPDGDDGHIGTFYKAGTSVLRNPKPFRVVLFKRH